jgi:hypothetical protein
MIATSSKEMRMNPEERWSEHPVRRYTKEDIARARQTMLDSLSAISGESLLKGCCCQDCCTVVMETEAPDTELALLPK